MSSVRILSWNIENFSSDKVKKHPLLLEEIARVILHYEADMVLIMETQLGIGEGFVDEVIEAIQRILNQNELLMIDEAHRSSYVALGTEWHMLRTDATFRAVDLPHEFLTNALVSEGRLREWEIGFSDDDMKSPAGDDQIDVDSDEHWQLPRSELLKKFPQAEYTEAQQQEIIEKIRHLNGDPNWTPSTALVNEHGQGTVAFPAKPEKTTEEVYEEEIARLYERTAGVFQEAGKDRIYQFRYTLKQFDEQKISPQEREALRRARQSVTQTLKDLGVINVNNETYSVLVRARPAENQLQVVNRRGKIVSDTRMLISPTPDLVYLDIQGKALGMHEPSSPNNGRCPMLLTTFIAHPDGSGVPLPILVYHLPFLGNKQKLIRTSFSQLNEIAISTYRTVSPHMSFAQMPDALLFGDFNVPVEAVETKAGNVSALGKYLDKFLQSSQLAQALESGRSRPETWTSLTTISAQEQNKDASQYDTSLGFRVHAYDQFYFKSGSAAFAYVDAHVIDVINDLYLGALHQVNEQAQATPQLLTFLPNAQIFDAVIKHNVTAMQQNANYLNCPVDLKQLTTPKALLASAFQYYRNTISDHLPIIAEIDIP